MFLNFLKKTLLTLSLALFALNANNVAFADDTQFVILDILPLQEGRTAEEAAAYMRDVEPIVAPHGLVRLDKMLTVVKPIRGKLTGQIVNFWVSKNPEATFKAIFSDPAYIDHFPTRRDKLFDMPNATIVVTKRNGR